MRRGTTRSAVALSASDDPRPTTVIPAARAARAPGSESSTAMASAGPHSEQFTSAQVEIRFGLGSQRRLHGDDGVEDQRDVSGPHRGLDGFERAVGGHRKRARAPDLLQEPDRPLDRDDTLVDRLEDGVVDLPRRLLVIQALAELALQEGDDVAHRSPIQVGGGARHELVDPLALEDVHDPHEPRLLTVDEDAVAVEDDGLWTDAHPTSKGRLGSALHSVSEPS